LREYFSLYGNGVYCPDKDIGILIFGGRGSGKTTLARGLVEQYGFLHVGDDCVSIDSRNKTMSWGSNHVGGDRLALRSKGEQDHDEIIFIPREKRIYEARIDIGVYLSRICNMHPSGSGVDGTIDTWHYLENEKIPVINLEVSDTPRVTLERFVRRIIEYC
jgi:hypothetical protein